MGRARFSMGRLGRLCLVHLARLHAYKRYSLPWAHLGIDADCRLPRVHAEGLGALGRAVLLCWSAYILAGTLCGARLVHCHGVLGHTEALGDLRRNLKALRYESMVP